MLAAEPRLASGEDHSGSTCIASFITPTHIIIANCGDSRAVLARGGAVFFGSEDHKPTDPGETARVQNAGGFIEMGRVCGNLAVSRSLGDFQYKDQPQLPPEQQKISAASDMTVIPRAANDNFLLLCCDGIWDVMSNEQAVHFVTDHLKAGIPPPDICERLLDHCLMKNSKDNMSAAVILLPGAPKPVPGFAVPDIGLDPEDEERVRVESQDAQALARRLSTIMNTLSNEADENDG
jgi:protein phosphatase 1B